MKLKQILTKVCLYFGAWFLFLSMIGTVLFVANYIYPDLELFRNYWMAAGSVSCFGAAVLYTDLKEK